MNKPVNNKQTSKKKISPANIVFTIFIILLGSIILILSYSIYLKLTTQTAGKQDINKAADIVQLEVMNGCGAAGIADKFSEYLREHNFDVVTLGNYRSYDINNSFVIDRTGNTANAEKVADALGIDRKYIVQQISDEYFLDVSLVIGRDYNNLKPLK